MLRAHADFPHPGSQAFLADSGEPARIVRHNRGDGTTLVSIQPTAANVDIGRLASGNRTVPSNTLCATLGEATGVDERGRPFRASKDLDAKHRQSRNQRSGRSTKPQRRKVN